MSFVPSRPFVHMPPMWYGVSKGDPAVKPVSKPDNYKDWEALQIAQIREQKAKDPKTIFGWALKGLISK